MPTLQAILLIVLLVAAIAIAFALWKALRQITRTAAEAEILARKLNQEIVPRLERVLGEAEVALAEAQAGIAGIRALAGRAEHLAPILRPFASVGNVVETFRQTKAFATAFVAGFNRWRDQMRSDNGPEQDRTTSTPQTEVIER